MRTVGLCFAWVAFFMVIIPLSGCKTSSLFRSKDRQAVQSSVRSEVSVLNTSLASSTLISESADSLSQTHWIEIYPLDSFRLSPEGTYTGKASKVRMEASMFRNSIKRDSMNAQEAQIRRRERLVRSDLRQESRQEELVRQKRKFISLNLIVGMLVGTVISVAIYHRYLKFRGR